MINSKLFYFIPIFLLSIFSCDNFNKNKINSSKGNSINEIISNELSSGVRNDTIFLGFYFGMTEDEYYNRLFGTLSAEGKVYKDEIIGLYVCEISTHKNFTYKCVFLPEFFESKLSDLKVTAQVIDSPYSFSLPESTSNLELYLFFMYKYGTADYEKKSQLIDDCRDFTWVDGNRKIDLMCGISKNVITYTDMSVKEKKDSLENVKMREKGKKSLSDI